MTKLLRRNKYCNYIWLVLDFVALFRYVTFLDRIYGTQDMKIISDNMRSLFNEYKDINIKGVYYELPLWLCSLFEYSLFGECIAKNTLQKLYKDWNSNQLSTAIYSIWLHVTRNMDEMNKGVVYEFVQYIKE